MRSKDDWENAKERYEAWWNGEIVDRPLVLVTAPRREAKPAKPWNIWDLVNDLEHPEKHIEAFADHAEGVFYGGEAFPNFWVNLGPGVMATFIGVEPEIREDTVWFEAPRDWDHIFADANFDEESVWWKRTQVITTTAARLSEDRYFVGITDLGGSLDLAASLRGAQQLALDLIESPEQVKKLLVKINELWFRYYDRLHEIVQHHMKGTSAWMGLWSSKRWYPLQCDFSAMISRSMFEEFVAPYLQEQARVLDRSIYHWDGPGQIPHLDILLDIPELDGIQWTPGSGNPGVGSPKWFDLYRRIQEKGKRLVLLDVEPNEVEGVLKANSAKGLLMSVSCGSEEEARDLLLKVERWSVR